MTFEYKVRELIKHHELAGELEVAAALKRALDPKTPRPPRVQRVYLSDADYARIKVGLDAQEETP